MAYESAYRGEQIDEAVRRVLTGEAVGPQGPAGSPGPPGADGKDGADGLPGPPGTDGKDGQDGATGPAGADGKDGKDGEGVPAGGAAGQVLAKRTAADYDTYWVDPPQGGGGGVAGVSSFNGRSGVVVPQNGDYTAADVGARPDTWTPTAAEVGARPTDWMPTAEDVGAIPNGIVHLIQSLTEAEYNALDTKTATTLYLIKE